MRQQTILTGDIEELERIRKEAVVAMAQGKKVIEIANKVKEKENGRERQAESN